MQTVKILPYYSKLQQIKSKYYFSAQTIGKILIYINQKFDINQIRINWHQI